MVKRRSVKRRSIKRRSVKRRRLIKHGGNSSVTAEEVKRVIGEFTSQQDKVAEALKNNKNRLQPIIDLYEIILENPHILLASNKFRKILFEKMTAIEKNKDIYGADAENDNENVKQEFKRVNQELKDLVNQYNKIFNDVDKIDLFQM